MTVAIKNKKWRKWKNTRSNRRSSDLRDKTGTFSINWVGSGQVKQLSVESYTPNICELVAKKWTSENGCPTWNYLQLTGLEPCSFPCGEIRFTVFEIRPDMINKIREKLGDKTWKKLMPIGKPSSSCKSTPLIFAPLRYPPIEIDRLCHRHSE